MNDVVAVLFVVLWAAIGLGASSLVLSRWFASRTSLVLGAIAVATFACGAIFPHAFLRPRDEFTAAAAPAAATAAVPPAAPPPAADAAGPQIPQALRAGGSIHDDGPVCRASHAGVGGTGAGFIDHVWVVHGADARGFGAGEAMADGSALPKADALRIIGWAVTSDESAPARAVCVVIDGRIAGSARVLYGGVRPDVAAVTNRPNLADSAYDARIDLASLGAGRHTVRVAAISRDGRAGYLNGSRTFVVSKS
jgi:hypothetical protein